MFSYINNKAKHDEKIKSSQRHTTAITNCQSNDKIALLSLGVKRL